MTLKYIEDGEDENVQRQKHNWNLTEQAAAIAAVEGRLGDQQSVVISSTPPDDADGRPDGTIYIQIGA